MLCNNCRHAIWDYETYYNTKSYECFVSGCKVDKEAFMIERNGEVVECDRHMEVVD